MPSLVRGGFELGEDKWAWVQSISITADELTYLQSDPLTRDETGMETTRDHLVELGLMEQRKLNGLYYPSFRGTYYLNRIANVSNP